MVDVRRSRTSGFAVLEKLLSTNISLRRSAAAVFIFAGLLSGCSTFGPWEETEDPDSPWIAPGRHVINRCRMEFPGRLIIADPKRRCQQLGFGRKRQDYPNIGRKIESYILKHEMPDFSIDRRASRGAILSGGRPLMVASVDPVIVIPVLDEGRKLRSIYHYEYLEKAAANVFFRHSLPTVDEGFWFSPDLDVVKMPLEFNDGVASIDWPGGSLDVNRDKSGLETKRQ